MVVEILRAALRMAVEARAGHPQNPPIEWWDRLVETLRAAAGLPAAPVRSEATELYAMDTAPLDGREVLIKVERRAGVRDRWLVGHWMPGGHCIEDHPPIEAGWYGWTGGMFRPAEKPVGWLPLPPKGAELAQLPQGWELELEPCPVHGPDPGDPGDPTQTVYVLESGPMRCEVRWGVVYTDDHPSCAEAVWEASVHDLPNNEVDSMTFPMTHPAPPLTAMGWCMGTMRRWMDERHVSTEEEGLAPSGGWPQATP